MEQSSVAGGLAGRRVLIVEDADDIRELLVFLVRLEGAEVRSAGTAAAALATAASWEFDVLLTDLGLPDMPGDLLIKQLRAMKTPRPRVVVATGYGEPYLSRARQAGADAVFVKPLEAAFGWSRTEGGKDPAAASQAAHRAPKGSLPRASGHLPQTRAVPEQAQATPRTDRSSPSTHPFPS